MDNTSIICVFERDLEDSDKGQLIQIFEKPKDVLEYIEKSDNQNLFWEVWNITRHIDDVKTLTKNKKGD